MNQNSSLLPSSLFSRSTHECRSLSIQCAKKRNEWKSFVRESERVRHDFTAALNREERDEKIARTLCECRGRATQTMKVQLEISCELSTDTRPTSMRRATLSLIIIHKFPFSSLVTAFLLLFQKLLFSFPFPPFFHYFFTRCENSSTLRWRNFRFEWPRKTETRLARGAAGKGNSALEHFHEARCDGVRRRFFAHRAGAAACGGSEEKSDGVKSSLGWEKMREREEKVLRVENLSFH